MIAGNKTLLPVLALAACLALPGAGLAQGRGAGPGAGQGSGQGSGKEAPACCPEMLQFYPKNKESLDYQKSHGQKTGQGKGRKQQRRNQNRQQQQERVRVRSGWSTAPAAPAAPAQPQNQTSN